MHVVGSMLGWFNLTFFSPQVGFLTDFGGNQVRVRFDAEGPFINSLVVAPFTFLSTSSLPH